MLEGTAVYLAPEIVLGGTPSFASDCWAFGCLVYQCLTGRPPMWAESQPEVMDKIVSFKASDSHCFSLPASAQDLVQRLMDPNPASRLGCGAAGVADIALHPFFEGVDIEQLHTLVPPPLAQGSIGPSPDAAWARRQYSIMISPMPTKYSPKPDTASSAAIPETDAERSSDFAPAPYTIPELAVL